MLTLIYKDARLLKSDYSEIMLSNFVQTKILMKSHFISKGSTGMSHNEGVPFSLKPRS